MQADAGLQRELPQDLVLMILILLWIQDSVLQQLLKKKKKEKKHIFFITYAIKKCNNLELKLCVTKHSPAHRLDTREK